MSEFFNVLPPDEARALLFERMQHQLPVETIPVTEALQRITAVSLTAPHPLPAFRRSTMDGYAVKAANTYGATDSLPAFLRVIGEIPMGAAATTVLAVGDAVIVHTGGMLPETADAVVQIEHTQTAVSRIAGQPLDTPFEIEVYKAVAVGQNVLQIGEDVALSANILPVGHRLRPQDIGGLLALGISEVTVRCRPRVAILATGDEVVPPEQTPKPGQIRDINTYTVAGLITQAGGIPLLAGIFPDDLDSLQTAAAYWLAKSDMLVMSAGSSVSIRDVTVQVIDSLGEPGVLLHGVATRPGKPTIVGAVGGKPILGLPGNPVSAMVQFEMFGVPAIYYLQGLTTPPRRGLVWARLSQNVASETGRVDFIPVRLSETEDGLLATPVFGKSNLIYTLVNADGLMKLPLNKGGLLAGSFVEVTLF